jgi:hypothetical protein
MISRPTLYLLKGCQNTPRLLSRVGIAFMAVAHKPLPDHIVDQWLEATLTNALSRHRPRVEAVEVDGDEVILVGKEDGELVGTRYRAGPNLKALREALRWCRENQLPDGSIDLLAWEDEAA